MNLKNSLTLWKRRETYRRRKWAFYRYKSKRPAAERLELRRKWWKLYAEAHEQRVHREKQVAASTPLRAKALTEALRQVGVMETGGNNNGLPLSRFIRSNGGTGPEAWCGDFVAFCYRLAGSKVVQRGWAAVRLLGFLTGMKVVSYADAEPGDIVCFTFDHTGILKEKHGSYIITVEGNTGASGAVSDSKTGGDGVYVKRRSTTLVARYVRVTR